MKYFDQKRQKINQIIHSRKEVWKIYMDSKTYALSFTKLCAVDWTFLSFRDIKILVIQKWKGLLQ